jgi:hypothetical protein
MSAAGSERREKALPPSVFLGSFRFSVTTPLSPLEDLVSYLVVEGMAEEWWSTISQRSPFLT